MAKIWETTVQQLIKQGLYVLVKEAVVPKEFEHLRRTGRSRRPAGPLLQTDMAKQGFFILLRWLIGVFHPLYH